MLSPSSFSQAENPHPILTTSFSPPSPSPYPLSMGAGQFHEEEKDSRDEPRMHFSTTIVIYLCGNFCKQQPLIGFLCLCIFSSFPFCHRPRSRCFKISFLPSLFFRYGTLHFHFVRTNKHESEQSEIANFSLASSPPLFEISSFPRNFFPLFEIPIFLLGDRGGGRRGAKRNGNWAREKISAKKRKGI